MGHLVWTRHLDRAGMGRRERGKRAVEIRVQYYTAVGVQEEENIH